MDKVLMEKIERSKKILKLASDMSEHYYHKPIIICYSGGKDSDVLLRLAMECLNQNEYEVLHSITTVDSPITNKYVNDMIEDLEEAIEHAHYNLYTRHKIKVSLSSFKRHDEYTACFQIEDTKEILTEKNIGTHLKGISKYLLTKYPEKYRPLQEGTRLLYYDMSPCSVSYF